MSALNRFRHLRVRILLISVATVIPLLLGFYFYVIPLYKNFSVSLKQEEVETAVTLVLQEIKLKTEELQQTNASKEEIIKSVKKIIHTKRYQDNDYFFVYDYNSGIVIAHGLKPEMEGTSRAESKDTNGKMYVKDFMEIAKTKGKGFVDYTFEKVVGQPAIDKISYIESIPGTTWFIGSGVYIENVDKMISSLLLKVNLGVLFILFIAFGFGWLVARRIANRLISISEVIAEESEKLASVAQKVSLVSEEMSSASTEQAAALHETSASLVETSTMIAKTAENSVNSLSASQESQSAAEKGQNIVSEMINSMQDIQQTSDDLIDSVRKGNQEMSKIIEVIKEIESKTKVINDIVFQTKLLSFNASVEAARAGEAGKGFAVVAEEVGSLATMSGNSALEITNLLSESIRQVSEVTEKSQKEINVVVEATHEKIESGVNIAKQCNIVLSDILLNAKNTTNLIDEISSASKEQTVGIQQINEAVAQLEQLSQKNKSVSDDTHKTSIELKQQVINLRQTTVELYSEVTGLSN